MLKVLDVFKVGDKLSVTLDGICDTLKNGSKLADNRGNIYYVVSVAMTRSTNPSDIPQSTTVLIAPCDIQKGYELYVA